MRTILLPFVTRILSIYPPSVGVLLAGFGLDFTCSDADISIYNSIELEALDVARSYGMRDEAVAPVPHCGSLAQLCSSLEIDPR